ncbi:5-(carboxyamino)imidazole ribonucleotide synthase [Sulfuriflexus sp.]|uniref:5-(carboxyamino)imidazole ribonucleotide synthase n=1 Tax=Sulfuriflexus sp. TaxID=2015443 RepID=UPI0028CDBE05|nr:5-(carboxyamino)imidazole ribonucleotide synthase [Sulfuriflexus sp.]MDT8403349.1 5-(carboxyamino)imidazole ribonucleotide synthase [Sulfuriflexus sp.]
MKIGVLGGGQLARMLSLAGTPLGVDFVFLCQAHDACAATVGEHLHARFDDKAALEQLATQVDLLTYEFESVPAESVEYLGSRLPVYPPPGALATARDRWHEKTLFNELGIKTADFINLNSFEDLQQAVPRIGLPAIIKTRTEGYDGKGQRLIRDESELAAAWEAMLDVPAIIEAFVPFAREVSIIAARSVSGELAFYPLTENEHRDGILRKSTALANDPMQGLAESYARRLLEHLDYVGVLAIEFFQVGDELLVNEMAPRVHNSGHWTIEGAETSQFENHIRAILDWPLGSTALRGHAVMLNLIGDLPDSKKILAQPHAHLHLYGKDERPGRKVGHITICAENEAEVNACIEAIGPV